MKGIKTISIQESLNGYKVQVGCQELVFTDKALLLVELSRYLDAPQAIEREYLERHMQVDFKEGGTVAAEATNQTAGRPYDPERELRRMQRAQAAAVRQPEGLRAAEVAKDANPVGRF